MISSAGGKGFLQGERWKENGPSPINSHHLRTIGSGRSRAWSRGTVKGTVRRETDGASATTRGTARWARSQC